LRTFIAFAVCFCCNLFIMPPADGIVEIKEDFVGNGEFQTFTNHNLAQDRALCKGDMAYGRSLFLSESNCSLFSGFETDFGSFQVASPEHYLRIADAWNISAKAVIRHSFGSIVTGDGYEINSSDYSYTMFRAEGMGRVRELVLSAGPGGRPLDLTSTYHTGAFRINSSARFET